MKPDLIVVYKGNPADAGMVKEMLADNGIMANLKNQLMGSIAPWHVAAGGFEPVEVEVLEKDVEQALHLIEQLNTTK